MRLTTYEAVRYEGVLSEGRTLPLILACTEGRESRQAIKVVKAIGCPEVQNHRQLAAEVIGNALANRFGVVTPEPCIVHIGVGAARAIKAGLASDAYEHAVQEGPAAGCELLRPPPAPYAVGQSLTADQRTQAARLYVVDMLTQNADRRTEKMNCALTRTGLVAFDFEMCFSHLFLPIIGVGRTNPWEPSRSMQTSRHLFYTVAKQTPPAEKWIAEAASKLTPEWWAEFAGSLPRTWADACQIIGENLLSVGEHPKEFAADIMRGLL
jgi:hypothetical protein